jgi:hypothetical protein
MKAIPRLKHYQGPPILSYGFRPFFFLGACYAATKVPEASQLIAILGDAFKLSLGALLMLLTEHAFALRR